MFIYVLAVLAGGLDSGTPMETTPLASVAAHAEASAEDLWKEALKFGAKDEESARRLVFVEMEAYTMNPPAMRSQVRSWQRCGIKVVPFLIHLLEEMNLSRFSRSSLGLSRPVCQATLLQWLAAAEDTGGSEYVVSYAREQLKQPVRTRSDILFLREIFMALAIDRSEKALDILFNIQSQSFWKSEKAPRIEFGDSEHLTKTKLENRKAQNELMSFALTSLEYSGTRRAICAFATGDGIAEMFTSDRVLMDDCFKRAVRAHVGLYGVPPEWYGEELPEET